MRTAGTERAREPHRGKSADAGSALVTPLHRGVVRTAGAGFSLRSIRAKKMRSVRTPWCETVTTSCIRVDPTQPFKMVCFLVNFSTNLLEGTQKRLLTMHDVLLHHTECHHQEQMPSAATMLWHSILQNDMSLLSGKRY